jgi:DNA-binding response OmpR family regulator
LIVVGPDEDPVVVADDVEDWLRLPVDDRDVRMRLLRLRDRATRLPRRPVLDGYSRLLFAGAWVGLSAIEERLARPLVDQFERVVSYRELLEAAWPGQHKDKIILRPRITGLRRRVTTIGLELRSIRDVGHLLEAS